MAAYTFPRIDPTRQLAITKKFWMPSDLREARQEMIERSLRDNPMPAYRDMQAFLGSILHKPYDELDRNELRRLKQCCPSGGGASCYGIFNGAAPTTAAPVVEATGTSIRTMLQVAPQTSPNTAIRVIEWGISFDGSAAATPGKVEFFGCTGAATMSTALAVADVMPFNNTNAPANTSGTGGVPLALGTGLTAFATGSVTEGTVATYRMADVQLLPPTGPYVKQFPLGREFECIGNQGAAQNFMRVRVTFGTTINMYCYVLFES